LAPKIKDKYKEIELVKNCLKNDQKAQKELYETYAPKMLGVCFRYINDYDIAHDTMQDVMIKVFQNLEKFRNEGGLYTWIKTISINQCLGYLKKERKILKIEIEDAFEIQTNEPNMLQNMEVDFIMKSLAKLPTTLRTVMNLNALEGYEYHEISKMLDIEEVSVRSQISRARKLLTEIIKLNKLAML